MKLQKIGAKLQPLFSFWAVRLRVMFAVRQQNLFDFELDHFLIEFASWVLVFIDSFDNKVTVDNKSLNVDDEVKKKTTYRFKTANVYNELVYKLGVPYCIIHCSSQKHLIAFYCDIILSINP